MAYDQDRSFCMEPENSAFNARVFLQKCNSNLSQRWSLLVASNGPTRMVNQASGLAIESIALFNPLRMRDNDPARPAQTFIRTTN